MHLPIKVAYADPPYPGRAKKYYGTQPNYGGEVDHVELIASLQSGGYDGWALSTSEDALRSVLPLCPPNARVCPWVKPIGASPRSHGLHNSWEPLIVVGGRQRRPGKRDWLRAQPARGGGEDLMGRKPLAFAMWLFECLGMVLGDRLVDLFPGTGLISRAWAELSRGARPLEQDPKRLVEAVAGDFVTLAGPVVSPAEPRKRLVDLLSPASRPGLGDEPSTTYR